MILVFGKCARSFRLRVLALVNANGVKEMLAELSESTLKSEPVNTEAFIEPKPEVPPGRVICLPASDEADEITAAMLAQLLEQGGYVVISFPPGPDLLHTVQLLKPAVGDVFCISSLPPFAFTNARTLSRQLRTHFPKTRIIVGVWGFAGETDRALERFHAPRPDLLVTSLEQAVLAVTEPG